MTENSTTKSMSPVTPAALPSGLATERVLDLTVRFTLANRGKEIFLTCLGSHTMTENHELHRRRRKPLEPFFSRMGIDKMEPMVIEEAQLLNDRMQSLEGTNQVIRLDHVFSAFAGDVIGRICSESPPEMMKNPEFGKEWSETLHINCMKRELTRWLQA